MRILSLIAAALVTSALGLGAQVSVEVVLDQDQFLRDEALPVKVRITNRSGQPLQLGRDNEWLTFAVELAEQAQAGSVARLGDAAVIGEFTLESARVAVRQVNLAPAFDLSQAGRYQVTATLRVKEWDGEISSRPRPFEIVRGTKLWEQEFGVPTASGVPEGRKYVLQQANYRRQLMLYLRVTDLADHKVMRVYPLGPLVSFSQPEAQIDKSSYLNVLFQTGPRSFLFHVVSPDGDVILRQSYDYAASRPVLRLSEAGRIFVSGGARRPMPTDIPPPLTSNTPRDATQEIRAAPTNQAAGASSGKDAKSRKKK